jgi:hypothetical protein
MNILAIDPGTEQSGFVVVDECLNILDKGIINNEQFRDYINSKFTLHLTGLSDLTTDIRDFQFQQPVALVIEGMTLYRAVSEDSIQTLIWIGRFKERFLDISNLYAEIKRSGVRKHLEADSDAGVVAALVDRFGGGSMKTAKGTKKVPGKFHGFKSHIWSAFAVAVTYVDSHPRDKFRLMKAGENLLAGDLVVEAEENTVK